MFYLCIVFIRTHIHTHTHTWITCACTCIYTLELMIIDEANSMSIPRVEYRKATT